MKSWKIPHEIPFTDNNQFIRRPIKPTRPPKEPRPRAPRKYEQQLQADILRFLETLDGCYVFKVVRANRAGVPDVFGLYAGKQFAFEVKRKNKPATPLQKQHIEMIRDAGGFAEIVDDWEKFRNLFLTFAADAKSCH